MHHQFFFSQNMHRHILFSKLTQRQFSPQNLMHGFQFLLVFMYRLPFNVGASFFFLEIFCGVAPDAKVVWMFQWGI